MFRIKAIFETYLLDRLRGVLLFIKSQNLYAMLLPIVRFFKFFIQLKFWHLSVLHEFLSFGESVNIWLVNLEARCIAIIRKLLKVLNPLIDEAVLLYVPLFFESLGSCVGKFC